MLSRFAKVLPGGAFEKPKNQQLSYGGMTATRANIGFFDCFFFLNKYNVIINHK